MERMILVVGDARKGEITGIAGKFLGKVYVRYGQNRVIKEYLKIIVGRERNKYEVANQILLLLKESER